MKNIALVWLLAGVTAMAVFSTVIAINESADDANEEKRSEQIDQEILNSLVVGCTDTRDAIQYIYDSELEELETIDPSLFNITEQEFAILVAQEREDIRDQKREFRPSECADIYTLEDIIPE